MILEKYLFTVLEVQKMLAALILTVIPGLAVANFVGNDTQNFNPLPSGLDFITVHSSQTLAPGLLHSGFIINLAKNTLPDTYDASMNPINSNDSILFGDLSLAYGLTQDLEVGMSLSYLLNQTTDRVAPGAQFGATGLNEIRLSGKYTLLERNPVGAAIVTSLNINQSERNPFAGKDAGPTFNLEGVVDYTINEVVLAANLGYRKRNTGERIVGSVYEPLPDQAIGSVAASYYASSIDTKFIFEIFAAKAMKDVLFVDKDKISSEVLLGAKHDLSDNASLHVGGGTRWGDGLFTPDWRVYSGLNINLDLLHKTQSAPVVAAAEQKIEKKTTIKNYKGYSPEDIEALKDVPFDQISKGREFVLRTTIPEKDFKGVKPPFEIIRLDNFDFDFGSSEIRKEHFPMLDKLRDYLASEPKVIKARIEGHTDSVGSVDRNKTRSQERADALRAYLKKSGVLDAAVVESVGYGSDRPIADNGNFQGRKQNRRVEIRILRRFEPVPESTIIESH